MARVTRHGMYVEELQGVWASFFEGAQVTDKDGFRVCFAPKVLCSVLGILTTQYVRRFGCQPTVEDLLKLLDTP